MKAVLSRDVPAGAALTIVALVLAASVVTGRNAEPASPGVVESAAPAQVDGRPETEEAGLDLAALARPRREREGADLFAPPAPPPAVAAAGAATPAKPTPPASPAAPVLPFRYLGRLVEGGGTTVFLARGNDTLAVRAGETLDGVWQVAAIGATAVTITYLPLRIAQQLPIPATP